MKRLCLLVLLALLTGCGGGEDNAKAKADFLKQAEAICAKAVADQKALTTPTAVPQLPPYVTSVVAIADEATKKLRALSLPDKDKKDLEAKVLNPLQEQLVAGHAYATKVSAAARANNQRELITLLGNPPTQTKADLRWMKSYGFSACVEAADTSD